MYPYNGYYPQNNMRSPIYAQPVQQQPVIQPEPVAQPVQGGVKVIPVASITEAQAVPTDFMGDTLILTDFAHGCIYTKVLNPNTGSAIFRVFKIAADEPSTPPVEYNAKTEIDKLYAELDGIKQKLATLESEPIQEAKKK